MSTLERPFEFPLFVPRLNIHTGVEGVPEPVLGSDTSFAAGVQEI